MFLRNFIFLAILSLFQFTNAQGKLNAFTLPDSLKEDANAVIRLNQVDISIPSRRSINIKTHRIITILNAEGLNRINAIEYFDNSTKIKSIEAVIYNAMGGEIKKIKKRDFKEQSVSAGSIITDNKVLYLDYTPVQYPFTVVYDSETESCNTAFIPSWSPMEALYVAVEKSIYTINAQAELGFKYKAYNFEGIKLNKSEEAGKLTLSVENIPAAKNEDYSPAFSKIYPHVLFGLNKFHLEGVDGEGESWENFGAWMYDNLLTGTDELSDETITKIKSLTEGVTNPMDKARIVYNYVQEKTRYVSIQLGIGGWKPMKAKDVDRLGYGDCKALTNYTRALLNVVGVQAYYTVIYGDRARRDLQNDFVSMQGNHIILAIPNENNYVWLECTSQTLPFGFQGDFTDNRLALLVKPGKGEIVKTHKYNTKGNTQLSKGNYAITANGAISGSVEIVSKGTQYDNKYYLESKSAEDLDKFYKSGFSNINNLKIKNTQLINNKQKAEFTESISIEAENYGNINGNRMMFALNAFNKITGIPHRYRNRKNPFEISRGFYDTDEITITLPEGYEIEAKPDNIVLSDKFGEYKTEYVVTGNQILYKRSLVINEGLYANTEYDGYRDFREKIARNDNAKIVLVKK
ncbi:DUF3857 domain-containing protein [Flavobacterium sp. MK4S-17]|uniref:DUF3857 domain-containing protein n=1 Tax=Flavobacterium sp. MK4S-17 TaxID=2543737 RepID=UPI00135BCEA6|nr:DUF3857 domain-containing protein [Flavobacterium sp. MK4S-17]